jgi:hypothetical protein
MKAWTTGEPRPKHAVLPGQVDAELAASRASMQGLDRTQLPVGAYGSQFLLNATHQVWTSLGGEQTNVNDSSVSSTSAWRAFTARDSVSGWLPYSTFTLTGHKGGMTQVQWSGCVATTQLWAATLNAVVTRKSPMHIGLKMTLDGVDIAERIGPCHPFDHFTLSGNVPHPGGNPVLSLYWTVTPTGPDEALEDAVSGDHFMKAHLWASQLCVIARYR